MPFSNIKQHLGPALISSIITFVGSSFYHQLSTVREISSLRATIETYIPSTERRLTGVENHAAVNDKRIDHNEVAIAKLERYEWRDRD